MRSVRVVVMCVALLGLLTLGAPGASAQTAPEGAANERLGAHQVSSMLGEWRGRGWSMLPDGSRVEFDVVERVRWNLAGTALLVEGFGFSANPETGEREVGHDAFALIVWDEQKQAPTMHARRAGDPGGGFATYDIAWDADKGALVWQVQPDRVRFIIVVADGVWTETGEYSPDGGGTWMRFLEMRLDAAR